jgi:FixJ family two-component response regulator
MANSQPTVLLVEDNELVRETVKVMLAAHGFPIVEAETAEQGIREFEANPSIAFAILDMILPGKSGLDLAAELERRRPGFRILYMSGLGDSIAMESIARRAPHLVLIKPFSEEILMKRVAGLLGTAVAEWTQARTSSISAITRSSFPWDRLVEASDELGIPGASVMSYRDTAAGFAIAVTHVAVLRIAQVPYAFRFTGNLALPLTLAVLPDDRNQAQMMLEQIGLGVDVAPAA